MENDNIKTENEEQIKKEKAAKERFRYLTETPVPNLILKLSVPTIISMLVTAIYNAADTFFVGKISTEATAAVGVSFSAMAIVQAFGFFCGQGSGNYLSRMLGAGKHREAEEMAATGLALSGIIGVIVAALVIYFIEPIAVFLGATPTMLKDTAEYICVIMIGAPFMMAQFVLNNQLRYQGSAIYAMIGLLFGAVLNIGLDPLLILGFHMGVRGAAIATVSGQVISFFVLFIGTTRGANIRIKAKNIRFTPHYLIEIINGGIPALFRQGLAAVATLLLNREAGVYGDAAIAGMSVTTRVMMFMVSALIGFGQGYQPVCSFNYGAGRKERVREGFYFCVKWGTIVLAALATVCVVFPAQIISFFRNDPAVIEVGEVALRFQALALPLSGYIVITNMMLQSMGKGIKASITASARNGLFFIPAIIILPKLFGITGVEITQAVADVLSISVCIPLATSELRKMKQEDQ